MGRVHYVAVLEEPSTQKRNGQHAEIVLASHAVVGVARDGRVVHQSLKVFHASWYLPGIEHEKCAVGHKVACKRQRIGSAHGFDARDCTQASKQIIELLHLQGFFRVFVAERGKR